MAAPPATITSTIAAARAGLDTAPSADLPRSSTQAITEATSWASAKYGSTVARCSCQPATSDPSWLLSRAWSFSPDSLATSVTTKIAALPRIAQGSSSRHLGRATKTTVTTASNGSRTTTTCTTSA